jgi:hypothetical protein
MTSRCTRPASGLGWTFQISTSPATAHGPRQETLATLHRAPRPRERDQRAAAPARVPDRRGGQTSTHQLSTKQHVMSDETPIVELLGATHVKVYASGRVDGAVGEDGLDGEQCVVNNCILHFLLRAWPPGSAIAGKAPRYPPG